MLTNYQVEFFLELIAALDCVPDKRLHAGSYSNSNGDVCAIGALFLFRGIYPVFCDEISKKLIISRDIIDQIFYVNDRCCYNSAEERWKAVRSWANMVACGRSIYE